MKILDTNTLTHLFEGHRRTTERFERENEEIATTIISRIEILQGRFAMLMKSADGQELRRAQSLLDEALESLAEIPRLFSIDDASAQEFDRLRQNKKLRKIGRADLLIAGITLANRATLVSRNLKHFRQVPGLQVENWAD
jgi:tRNA(fMet)-specific endonuclease VapC